MTESARLDAETARAEANIIASITRPMVENAIKKSATPGGKLEKMLPKLGDPAYMELGGQLLEQMKEEKPRLYGALVTRERAFAGLVGVIYPSYIDFKEKRYIPPAKRRIMAEGQPEEVKRKAWESAKNTASVIVNGIVQEIEDSKLDYGVYPETQDLVVAGKIIKKEIEEGYFIKADNTEAVASLLGCTLASLQTNRYLKNFNMQLEFKLGDALKKQVKFDQSKE